MDLKHKIATLLMVFACSMPSANAKSLVIVLIDGSEVYYNIDTQSAIMHLTDGNVTVEVDSYQFSNIERFYISNEDAPSAIDNAPLFRPVAQDGILYVPNQDSATLYTMDGKEIVVSRNGKNTQTFNLTSLPSGTYLLKTKNATLKFIKK